MLSWLLSIDKSLFELINGQWNNGFFDVLMPFWRNKLSWIPLYVLITAVLSWKYRWKTLPLLILTVLVILVADQVSSELIKKTFMRLRPCNEPTLEEQIRILVHCGSGYSFTSSHATNHFALAFLFTRFLLPLLPKNQLKARWSLVSGLFFWAFLVAYAQVYVGVHYPLDVFCGALLGTLVAAVMYALFQYITKKYSTQP